MITFNWNKLKPGDLVLYKKYNLFKHILYILLNKELPYNKVDIITNDTTIAVFSDSDEIKFLSPKKSYSKNEIKMLNNIAKTTSIDTNKTKDIIETVNEIRPNTLPENATISDIMNSTYYKENINAEEISIKIYN